MKNKYKSPMGTITVNDNNLVLEKTRKQFIFFGPSITTSEQTIPYNDIASVEIGTLQGNIGYIKFNIKGQSADLQSVVRNKNTLHFKTDDLKRFEELKELIDNKIN